MTKSDEIQFRKNQLASAERQLALGRQIIAEATQSKVEHTTALEMLGNTPKQNPKREVLTENVKASLTGRLTLNNPQQ